MLITLLLAYAEGVKLPKRVVDGEAVWTSRKLKMVEPEWVRGEYTNLLPLALANGVFELDVDQIWARVYAYLRPSISREDVAKVLAAFEQTGLLFRWQDEGSKAWGFWVGIDKPGRLPSSRRQKGRHERVGPDPPSDQLDQYVRGVAGQWSAIGRPMASLGFGLGSGSGSGPGPRASHAPENPAPSAPGVCEKVVAAWNTERGPLSEVKKLTETRRRKINARIQSDPQFLKTFTVAVQKAARTPFLCGTGDRGWKANFDWMIENDTNAVAVTEGKYDDGKGGLTNGEQRTHNNLKAGGFIQ